MWGTLGCDVKESHPFANLQIELPRAAHGAPLDAKECVAIAIVPSASGAGESSGAAILVGAEKFEPATYAKARGADEGRRELVKAIAEALTRAATVRDEPGTSSGGASEVPVFLYADRRAWAEHFDLSLGACARARLYKLHVCVVDGDGAPVAADMSRPVLRCWLPWDVPGVRWFTSLPRPVLLWELTIALKRSGTATECTTTEVPSRALPWFNGAYDPLGRTESERKKILALQPSAKHFVLASDASLLVEEITRINLAFAAELRELAAEGITIPHHLREEGMPVTLEPAPDVFVQDIVTVLDACRGIGIMAIAFRKPEWQRE